MASRRLRRSTVPRRGSIFSAKPKTLGQKRRLFTKLLARLILKAERMGFEPQGDELRRAPETAKLYAEQGRGIANSLHNDGLAIDLDLIRDGHPAASARTTDEGCGQIVLPPSAGAALGFAVSPFLHLSPSVRCYFK